MSKRLDQLPPNTTSANCIIYGEENNTTSVQIAVNAPNGIAGLDGNGIIPEEIVPTQRTFNFFAG